MTKEKNVGWECPRCGSIDQPQMERCKCIKVEDTNQDTRKLLTE